MTDLPRVGAIIRLVMPGDIRRRCRVLGYDHDMGMFRAEWIDYALSDEWLPLRYLEDRY